MTKGGSSRRRDHGRQVDETLGIFTAVLCDDTLAHVLSYLDLNSIVRFSKCTSKSLQRRIFSFRSPCCCSSLSTEKKEEEEKKSLSLSTTLMEESRDKEDVEDMNKLNEYIGPLVRERFDMHIDGVVGASISPALAMADHGRMSDVTTSPFMRRHCTIASSGRRVPNHDDTAIATTTSTDAASKDGTTTGDGGDCGNATSDDNAKHQQSPQKPETAFDHVWRHVYQRHHFSPPEKQQLSSTSFSSLSVQNTTDHIDYLSECRKHRTLFQNLTGESTTTSSSHSHSTLSRRKRTNKSQRRNSSCFTLPNRYFHFVPIIPRIEQHDDDDDDDDNDWGEHEMPPPVDFVCDSFALTSPGTSGEFVLLDPFDGSILVYSNILDNAVASDEAMLERAMRDAAAALIRRRKRQQRPHGNDDDHHHDGALQFNENRDHDNNDDGIQDEQHVAGMVIDQAVYRNHNLREFTTQPMQVLFDVEDYFSVNLADYFTPPPHHHHREFQNWVDGLVPEDRTMFMRRGNNNNNIENDEEDEVVIDWMGIDVHTVLDCEQHNIVGSLIGAARILSNEAQRVEDEMTCTEIIGWKRKKKTTTANDCLKSSSTYDEKFLCGVMGSPYYIDICATKNKVYAVFSPGDGPFPDDQGRNDRASSTRRRRDGEYENAADEEDELMLDVDAASIHRSRTVVRYPFLPASTCLGSSTSTQMTGKQMVRKFFPSPELRINCAHPVTSLNVDPAGDRLVVGTVKGTIEVWDTRLPNKARRLQTLHLHTSVLRRLAERSRSPPARRLDHTEPNMNTIREEHMNVISTDDLISSGGHGASDAQGPGVFSGEDASRAMTNGNTGFCSVHHENTEPNANSTRGQDCRVETLDNGGENIQNSHDEHPIFISNPNNQEDGVALSFALPRHDPNWKVDSVYIPRHLPLEQCGFVSMQHHYREGTTLSLWQKPSMGVGSPSGNEKFELMTFINLPLSVRRKPQVSYDGRRLIVFGQDHIGHIILVYHVLSTWEDQSFFSASLDLDTSKQSAKEEMIGREESGGVHNLTRHKRVRFANRIRHVGLGGLEYYDSMFMTCNERYIVVNTKTGNLVGGDGGRGANEGLLVIDLEDYA